MKGIVFTGDRKAEVREFPTPDPGPGEVLVRMAVSSYCGTDMHFYRKGWDEMVAMRKGFGGSPETITGHEPCGVVETIGPHVKAVKPGDRVTIYQHVGCEHCNYCRQGDMMFCPDRMAFGTVFNGSAADYIISPERNCLKLPDTLTFERAVVISCAGGTSYQSVRLLEITAADTVAVFGLGPVGLSAAMFASALGARVFGIDVSADRLDLAGKACDLETINAAHDDPVEVIRDLTAGEGISAGGDYSGNQNAQEAMLKAAGKGARLAVVGLGDTFRVDPQQHIMKKLKLMGTWIYNIGQHEDIIDFVLKHDLPLEKMITHRFRIEQGVEALECFDSGKTGKIILTWED
jgi:threonine dehydrogenase-like Zn-dependent dehydrogenase